MTLDELIRKSALNIKMDGDMFVDGNWKTGAYLTTDDAKLLKEEMAGYINEGLKLLTKEKKLLWEREENLTPPIRLNFLKNKFSGCKCIKDAKGWPLRGNMGPKNTIEVGRHTQVTFEYFYIHPTLEDLTDEVEIPEELFSHESLSLYAAYRYYVRRQKEEKAQLFQREWDSEYQRCGEIESSQVKGAW
jgi:hypothetical protein